MSRENRKTAVVIVAHREYATLERCIRGFSSMLDDPADLIFVDNGSGGTLERLVLELCPGITVITLDENRYFCGGYNAGIAWAMNRSYDYVLIVNADTEVVNGEFIKKLLDSMERSPRAAFIGPEVYYRRRDRVQTTCLHFPNLFRSIWVWIPFRIAPDLITRQTRREHSVEFLNGVCVLCRIPALREIGLMDESYQAYVEDAEWSLRARKKGWMSLFVPVPSIIHHEEDTGYEHYSFKSFLLKRNTVKWFLTAGRPFSALVYAGCSLALAYLRTIGTTDLKKQEPYRRFARALVESFGEVLQGNASAYPPQDSSNRRKIEQL